MRLFVDFWPFSMHLYGFWSVKMVFVRNFHPLFTYNKFFKGAVKSSNHLTTVQTSRHLSSKRKTSLNVASNYNLMTFFHMSKCHPANKKKFYKMREENPFIIKWHFRSHNLSECQTVTNWQKRTFSSTEMQFNTNPRSSKFELFSHNFPTLPRAMEKTQFFTEIVFKKK